MEPVLWLFVLNKLDRKNMGGESVRKPWTTYPTVMLNVVKHLNTSTSRKQISHFVRNDREKGKQKTILG